MQGGFFIVTGHVMHLSPSLSLTAIVNASASKQDLVVLGPFLTVDQFEMLRNVMEQGGAAAVSR